MKYLIGVIAILTLAACSTKLSEEEYYNKAKQSYADQKTDEAIKNFQLLTENYPNGQHNAEALFMLGYINANDLKKYDEAKKYYEEFLKKYPKHELADDAQYELNTMGKDINDLPIFKKLTADSTDQKSDDVLDSTAPLKKQNKKTKN